MAHKQVLYRSAARDIRVRLPRFRPHLIALKSDFVVSFPLDLSSQGTKQSRCRLAVHCDAASLTAVLQG